MRTLYKWLVGLCAVTILGVGLLTLPALAQERDLPGFYVEGRHLYDYQGNKVILYGVNKMVIYTDRDGLPSFEEIAKTGANVVRIVWLTEGTAVELDTAITNAYNNDLIPMIECHDATGNWDMISVCVDYWVRPDVLEVIKKHERYLLLNIANEAGDGVVSEWPHRAAYTTAIYRMREAGIHVPLIIDAQGYGQSINDLQLNGPYLQEIDPDHNLMFGVHTWWPSAWRGANVDQQVIDEIAESVEMELPLIVSEFASMGPGCVCCIPYETIIEQCYLNEVGYLAWSWGPGNGDCVDMDMTEDGTYATLHDWGEIVAISSPYSIKNIAVRPAWIVDEPPIPLVPTATPSPTMTPLPALEGLISLDVSVTASSLETDVLLASNAVDGKLDTRWSSAYEDHQELVLDLGSVQPIGKIILVWEAAYGKEYKLDVSDDNETWAEIVHVTDGDGDRDIHQVDAQGRYVRLDAIQRGTEWGFSLYEFWVFSDADAPEPEFTEEQTITEDMDTRPDLVVKDITWSSDRAMQNVGLTFDAVVSNVGSSATDLDAGWQVRFNVNGENVALSAPVDEALSPGMDINVSAESQWIPAEEGEYVVMAYADHEDVVDEADQHNNIHSVVVKVYAGTLLPTKTAWPTATPEITETKEADAETTNTLEGDVLPESDHFTSWRILLVPVVSLLVLAGVVWLLRKRRG